MSVASHLREVPALAELSHTSLDLLAFAFVETVHEAGETVEPDGAYPAIPRIHVVLDGEIELQSGTTMRSLGPGAMFGFASPGARYRARGACRTAELSPYAFARLSSAPSELAAKFRRAMGTILGTGPIAPPPSATDTLPAAPAAAAVGSVLATVVAALACVGPIVAAALGIGGVGLLADATALRVPAMLLTIALLAFGFRRAYRENDGCRGPSKTTRVARGMLWVATTFALTMALLQYVTLPYLT